MQLLAGRIGPVSQRATHDEPRVNNRDGCRQSRKASPNDDHVDIHSFSRG